MIDSVALSLATLEALSETMLPIEVDPYIQKSATHWQERKHTRGTLDWPGYTVRRACVLASSAFFMPCSTLPMSTFVGMYCQRGAHCQSSDIHVGADWLGSECELS